MNLGESLGQMSPSHVRCLELSSSAVELKGGRPQLLLIMLRIIEKSKAGCFLNLNDSRTILLKLNILLFHLWIGTAPFCLQCQLPAWLQYEKEGRGALLLL